MHFRILALVVTSILLSSIAADPSYSQSKSDAFVLLKGFDESMDKARTPDDVERILSEHERPGDNLVQYSILTRVAGLYAYWGLNDKALHYYTQAFSRETTLDEFDRRGAIRGIASAYVKMGLQQKALDHLEGYLAQLNEKAESGNEYARKEIAFTQLEIGKIWRYGGQYQNALENFSKARSSAILMSEGGDYGELSQHVERYALWEMAQVYEGLGHLTKSVEFCEKFLKSVEGGYGEEIYSTVLVYLGHLYARMSKPEKALELAKAGEGDQLADTDVRRLKDLLANLYLDTGSIREAELLIRELGSPRSMGRLYLEEAEPEKAAQQFEKLRQSAESSRNVDELVIAYTGLGRTNEVRKNYRKAEEFYAKALEQIEELRSGLLPAERKNFYDVKISGFSRSFSSKGLTRIRIKTGQLTTVTDSSEMTKARAFADQIALRSQIHSGGIPGTILDKENELATHLANLKKDLARTDKNRESGRYESLIRKSKKAESDLKAFVDMLWSEYRAYAAVRYPRPVAVKDSALRNDECILYFDVSEEGFGVIMIRNKKVVKAVYSDVPRSALEKDIRKFLKSFKSRDIREFNQNLGESLYRMILSKSLVDVPPGTPITIIPDGILALLPIEALVIHSNSDINKITYLGDLYPISYYPSLTSLALTRTLRRNEASGDRLLCIADPIFQLDDERVQRATERHLKGNDREFFSEVLCAAEEGANFRFKRLPMTGLLAKNLQQMYAPRAEIYTDSNATKDTFLKDISPRLREFRAVVFATHGHINDKTPMLGEPFLALTMVPPGTDGFLRMTDVMSLQMNADIVALTACQTGLGRDVTGEGVMSMGRAFQFAGARTVLMSLWSVAENSSVILVESFFRNLKQGKSKRDALRLAREEIRKSGYDHPFFWAPFILVGESQ